MNIAPFLRSQSPVKNLIKTEEVENAMSEIEKWKKLFDKWGLPIKKSRQSTTRIN
jgi:hypothetical protein